MKIKDVLEGVDALPSEEELKSLKEKTLRIIDLLNWSIKKNNVRAEVFVGGSFAKQTLAKADEYDVDIFVRFSENKKDFSRVLEGVVLSALKKMLLAHTKIHGSRDYFRIKYDNVTFEIIPVKKISRVSEASNVTDLSYFHVKYVRKKMNNKLKKEIAYAKKFFKAQRVYGAESYVQGFSGYAIECLIIYYKSFEKMIKNLSKTFGEKIVIDPKRYYKNKHEAIVHLNESKVRSPIVLVDPTWKERNILAALSEETFRKFQIRSKEFIKNPSPRFFMNEEISEKIYYDNAKKIGAEYLHILLETDRQEGDICATKMKKFTRYLSFEIEKNFNLIKEEFYYAGGKKAEWFCILKKKENTIKIGPPIYKKNNCKEFKKKNRGVFEKDGRLYAKIKTNFSAKSFINGLVKKNRKKMTEMNIIRLEVL